MAGFHLKVFEEGQVVYQHDFQGPLQIGRQEPQEPPPYALTTGAGLAGGNMARLIIARLEETSIGRRQLEITPLSTGALRLRNLSQTAGVWTGNTVLGPGESTEIGLPVIVRMGPRSLRLEQPPEPLNQLMDTTLVPRAIPQEQREIPSDLLRRLDENSDIERFLYGLQITASVMQSAMGSSDFFEHAAQAVVELAALDAGRLLMWDGQKWTVRAESVAVGVDASTLPSISSTVLARLLQDKRTYWRGGGIDTNAGEVSLLGIEAVVAAPVLGAAGQVLGAVYGHRRRSLPGQEFGRIGRIEARLVELIACSVASGLVRLEQEDHAARMRTRFEQFNSRELAEQLERQPDLLRGRDAEVSLLFCDIRGFSRVSERLGADAVFEWINEVMGALSECVLQEGGVIVDYHGDEVMAMWGAPQPQEDHARRACQAGLAMLARMPELNSIWSARLPEPVSVGIGVHTGPVRVGNSGTERKFKYGPLGHTVNLASRVQGATKYLQMPLLVTGATRAQLGPEFETRKLCDARVINIRAAVSLHELVPHPDAAWKELRTSFEAALQDFESRQFGPAAARLGKLIAEYPADAPTMVLMGRVLHALSNPAAPFDAVWELPGK